MKYFSNLGSDGHSFGQSVSDKISFYGVSAIVQPSASAQAVVTTAAIASVTTTTPTITAFGYTSAQAAAILTAINDLVTRVTALTSQGNALQDALLDLGLIKGSA